MDRSFHSRGKQMDRKSKAELLQDLALAEHTIASLKKMLQRWIDDTRGEWTTDERLKLLDDTRKAIDE